MTAKIIVTFNDAEVSEHVLDKETTVIGRHPDNDIHIDNIAVSGSHAKIITILTDSFLEDLNSTNGTLVNGKPIQKHALKDGDVIEVGVHHLTYENAAATAGGGGDFEATMIIRPDAIGGMQESSTGEVDKTALEEASIGTEEPKKDQEVHLNILNGTNAGEELKITKALTTLGKPGTQVAAITKRPQGYFIIHIEGGSNNKTPIINGKEVGPKATQLHDKDVVEIAGVKMEFVNA